MVIVAVTALNKAGVAEDGWKMDTACCKVYVCVVVVWGGSSDTSCRCWDA